MGWCLDMFGVKQIGKKVVIIGVGLVGLVCVDVLMCNGVKVVVFDCYLEIGGLLIFGILVFKLEKEVMMCCCEIFIGMGIEFKFNIEVGCDVQLDDLLSDYDVVFFGVGIYQLMCGGLENEDVDGVYVVLLFFIVNIKQLMGFGEICDELFVSMEGKCVVVFGGGDIVMDCVCIVLCYGVSNVICVYCCDEVNMSGLKKEVKNVCEEGVNFEFNVQLVVFELNE